MVCSYLGFLITCFIAVAVDMFPMISFLYQGWVVRMLEFSCGCEDNNNYNNKSAPIKPFEINTKSTLLDKGQEFKT